MDPSLTFDQIYEENADSEHYDKMILARNLFDLRELKKCAYVLKDYKNDLNNQDMMFLHYYSLFLHGAMKKEENKYLIDHSEGKLIFEAKF